MNDVLNSLIYIFHLLEQLVVLVYIITLDLSGIFGSDDVKTVANDGEAWQIAICITLKLSHLSLGVVYLPFDKWVLTLLSHLILHSFEENTAFDILRFLRSFVVAVIKLRNAVSFNGDRADG